MLIDKINRSDFKFDELLEDIKEIPRPFKAKRFFSHPEDL